MLGWVPDGVLLPLCIVGIYTCYFTYGYLQEEIIAVEKLNPILPLFCQYLFAVIVGSTLNYMMDRHETPKPAFLTTRELKIGVLNNLTMMSSNYALAYVDYPTQALVKSSKILPVMLMGIVRGTYNHPLYKYICATIITLGIILFNVAKLGNKVTDLTFSMTGSMLLLLSLLFDGLVGTETDKDKHSNQSHNPFKLMTGSNIVGLLSSSSIIFMEYMSSGINPLSQIHLGNVSGLMLIAAAGAMGQIFIYVTINRFDCFLLSIVNTSRKFFSILLSIIWFKKFRLFNINVSFLFLNIFVPNAAAFLFLLSLYHYILHCAKPYYIAYHIQKPSVLAV